MSSAHKSTDRGSVLRGYVAKVDEQIAECDSGSTDAASTPMQKAIYKAVAGHLKHAREHLNNAAIACDARK